MILKKKEIIIDYKDTEKKIIYFRRKCENQIKKFDYYEAILYGKRIVKRKVLNRETYINSLKYYDTEFILT